MFQVKLLKVLQCLWLKIMFVFKRFDIELTTIFGLELTNIQIHKISAKNDNDLIYLICEGVPSGYTYVQCKHTLTNS